jgi:hypothetical protein
MKIPQRNEIDEITLQSARTTRNAGCMYEERGSIYMRKSEPRLGWADSTQRDVERRLVDIAYDSMESSGEQRR